MKHRLLASVAVVALVNLASAAWADDDNTANNNAGSAITQDGGGDVVTSGGTAVVEGAYSGNGNALGEFSERNAAADQSSTAVQVNAPYGVAGFGSGVNVGNGNQGASSTEGSAAATGSSTAISTFNEISDGSAHVIGNNNLTAAAEEGGAALGANGTAIGIKDVDINADDVTAGFGEGNVVASAHLDEVTTVNTHVFAEGNLILGSDGFFFVDADVAGLLAYGPGAAITTGNINNQSVGSLSGANMVAGNTGLANQGDAIGIGANGSF